MDGDPKPLKVVAGVSALVAALAAAFAAAYGLTSLLYQYTGIPPEAARAIVSGVVGLLVFFGAARLFMVTIGRKHVQKQDQAYGALQEAMTQIARGNFDIALNPELDDRLRDLTVAVNGMAKGLGTLETMRQDFISNVSHEIQSPLTSISGFAALLQKEGLPDEERRRYAAIIEAESKRLSSLSDNMLKLSSLDNSKLPLSMQRFSLDRQLERVALTLEPQWSAKQLAIGADLQRVDVSGDEDLLSQVWMNLLHNAIKFTPEGGRIDVALKADGGFAVVKIADTGVGIAPEEQIHIFERFYKVDKARDRSLGGNGLGLSLVKKIVELHDGSVSVESNAGEGAVFTVVLKAD